jgi:hypothetical protein
MTTHGQRTFKTDTSTRRCTVMHKSPFPPLVHIFSDTNSARTLLHIHSNIILIYVHVFQAVPSPHPTRDSPAAWGLGGELQLPTVKTTCYDMVQSASHIPHPSVPLFFKPTSDALSLGKKMLNERSYVQHNEFSQHYAYGMPSQYTPSTTGNRVCRQSVE